MRKLLASRHLRLFLALAGGLIILLHALGFKIFGSATVYDNEVLAHPVPFAAIRPPGALEFINGRTCALAGIQLLPGVDWNGQAPSPSGPSLELLVRANMPQLLADIEELPGGTIRAFVKVRKHYWCGNTWFPCFLPERLPRYGRADLAEMLINGGLARVVPGSSPISDTYLSDLMEREHTAIVQGAGRWSDPNVSRQFIDPKPLLDKLRQPYVLSEWLKHRGICDEIIESSQLLLRMEVSGVREAMMSRIRDEEDEVYVRTRFARELAMRNDLEGVDYLVNRIATATTRPHWSEDQVSSDVRAHEVSILRELQQLMQRSGRDAGLPYEDQRRVLAAWYNENRPKLRWLEREYRLGIPAAQ